MGTLSFNELIFEYDYDVREQIIKELPTDQRVLYALDCAIKVLPILNNSTVASLIGIAKDSVLKNNVEKEQLRQNSYVIHGIINSLRLGLNEIYNSATVALYANNAAFERMKKNGDRTVTGFTFSATTWSSHVSNSWKFVTALMKQAQPTVPFPEQYKTPDTIALAKEILDDNFDLMPILADALLDLGCPEKQADKVRKGTGYSNWALHHLRNTESRDT